MVTQNYHAMGTEWGEDNFSKENKKTVITFYGIVQGKGIGEERQ
jgi:hypothetical protein